MSFIGDIFGGGKAADAAIKGSEVTAQGQREALQYLKDTERLPQHYRESALGQLGSLYGLSPPPMQAARGGVAANMPPELQGLAGSGLFGGLLGEIQQQNPGGGGEGEYLPANQPLGRNEFIQGLLDDPFYQASLERGEEGILRNASATGGLRSGNVQDALYRANQDALFGVYNDRLSGLQGLAGLPSNANNIAATTAGIGETLGQGIIGAGQARATAQGQGMSAILGGLQAAASGGAFSDNRLKSDIEYIGKKNGHKLYKWTWNKLAGTLGLVGESVGVMADKVEKYMPEAIGEAEGFKTVDYKKLGLI